MKKYLLNNWEIIFFYIIIILGIFALNSTLVKENSTKYSSFYLINQQ